MEKVYEPINWENYPSIATPINEKNLNKMDSALDEVDNRVIGLDTAKLDKATANTMVKDISFNEETGIFIVTLLNGTVKTIDTKLEKIATNFKYDPETQKLLLTLVDGTEQEVDLSSLISQYEFTDSDYITFEVGNDGKVKATIKSGSITEDMLQPNFLADVKVEVEKAKSSANSASNSADEAKQYRDETEQMKNEIESVTNVEIATIQKAGIVKPDGDTITIDNEGKISAKQKESASSWNDLENKPFSTLGSGLIVENETLKADILKTMEEIEANEDENKLAGALAVKELNKKVTASNGTHFRFEYNAETGEYGYIVADSEGADTFVPFSSGDGDVQKLYEALQYSGLVTEDMTFEEICSVLGDYFTESLDLMALTIEEWAQTIPTGESVSFTIPFNITCSKGKGGTFTVQTNEIYDITRFKTLTISGSFYSITTNVASIRFVNTLTGNVDKQWTSPTAHVTTTHFSNTVIDVSELSGKYYIKVTLPLTSGYTHQFALTKALFE